MKKPYMWGCRVTFDGGIEEWALETTPMCESSPYVFTLRRRDIMPLVRMYRTFNNVSHAVAVRVRVVPVK